MTNTNNFRNTISVVIRCYNEQNHIGKLLHGLMQQTKADLEIIVVDSGSTDETTTIANRYSVKILTINPSEFSFGKSLNYGCETASSDFIVIASAHVYPIYKDWLEQLLYPFQDPSVGLVYGKQRGGETTRYSEHQIFEKWFPNQSNFSQPHAFCNNANAVIRKSVWNQYRYNEELTGLEDVDFADRILKSGHKIAYQHQAAVCHIHNEMPHQIYNRYRREAIALKRIYPNEHFHFGDFLRLYIHNVFSDFRQTTRNGLQIKHLYDIPLFRYMQFWGTYQGFKKSGPLSSQLKQTFYYPNHNRPKSPSKISRHMSAKLINYSSEGRAYRENR